MMLEVMSSSHTLRGPSINDNMNSYDTLGSITASGAAQNSKSLLDQVSVRDIMNVCQETVGKSLNDSQSIANRQMKHFRKEKTKTDDAMDRLKLLCDEYCDQLNRPSKNIATSKSQTPSAVQHLLDEQ